MRAGEKRSGIEVVENVGTEMMKSSDTMQGDRNVRETRQWSRNVEKRQWSRKQDSGVEKWRENRGKRQWSKKVERKQWKKGSGVEKWRKTVE